jgi:hypothetical protein
VFAYIAGMKIVHLYICTAIITGAIFYALRAITFEVGSSGDTVGIIRGLSDLETQMKSIEFDLQRITQLLIK